jgi:hypothetical protein
MFLIGCHVDEDDTKCARPQVEGLKEQKDAIITVYPILCNEMKYRFCFVQLKRVPLSVGHINIDCMICKLR